MSDSPDDPGFTTPLKLQNPVAMPDPATRDAYRRVFQSLDGRIVLADMLRRAGLGTPGYIPQAGINAADIAFFAGQKSIVLDCLTLADFNTDRLGAAVVSGTLETLMEPQDETAPILDDNDAD